MSYVQFGYNLIEKPDPVIQKLLDNSLIHGGVKPADLRQNPVLQQITQHEDSERVWILAHEPVWYRLLKVKPITPYLDSRALPYILPGLRAQNPLFWATQVPERELFLFLEQGQPSLIIDPDNYFPKLQLRYPTLLGTYKGRKVGTYMIYRR